MKIHKRGEKSKAMCGSCEGVRSTTFQARTVPFRHREGSVSELLVSVCDDCDTVVGIPQQSVPRISKAIQTRHPVEARLPRHLVDALNLTIYELSGESARGAGVVLRFYLSRLASAEDPLERLHELVSEDEAQGTNDGRFSTKVGDRYRAMLETVTARSGLSRANLIRGIVVQAKRDVLDNERPSVRKELASHIEMAGV